MLSSLALLFALVAPAHATVVETDTLRCPTIDGVGGQVVVVHTLRTENRAGGWDADGARYSRGGQFREHKLTTCPASGLTLVGRDLSFGLTEDELARLPGTLASIRERWPQPAEAPVWERYRMAVEVYRALGRGPLQLATLWLEGAWTVRDHGVGFWERLEGPLVQWRLLEEIEQELQKDLTPEQQLQLRFSYAKVAHRAGAHEARDNQLDTLKAMGLSGAALATWERLDEARRTEPAFLDGAIKELGRYLESGRGTAIERSEAAFRLGELLRRRGRIDEARKLLRATRAMPGATRAVRRLVDVTLERIDGGRPWITHPLDWLNEPQQQGPGR